MENRPPDSVPPRNDHLQRMGSVGETPDAGGTDPLPVSPGHSDPRYLRFIVDLFGVIAYGELSGFERLSSDARFSPSLADRAGLGRLAVLDRQWCGTHTR